MTTDIRLIHARDFVRVTSDGKLDFEQSKRILTEIASATAPLVEYEILLDTRQAHVQMSEADLWYLAAELSNLRKAFSGKTAVLCPVERFDEAAFFALCSGNRGIRVKAFTSFEDSINWLVGMAPDA